jgi:hypothetical protein
MTNWKACGLNLSWPVSSYSPFIYLEVLKEMLTSIRVTYFPNEAQTSCTWNRKQEFGGSLYYLYTIPIKINARTS